MLINCCGTPALESLGFQYHARRGSDRRQLSDIQITDIPLAFEKLDDKDKLPSIYCEANDLIKLPSLETDPVSKRVEANAECIRTLSESIYGLPSRVSEAVTPVISAPISSCSESLSSLVSNVAAQVQQLVSCVESLKSVSCATSTSNARLSSSGPVPHSTDASSAFSGHSNPPFKQAPRSFDRSANLVLFGLPEYSLLNTISEIDNISKTFCRS